MEVAVSSAENFTAGLRRAEHMRPRDALSSHRTADNVPRQGVPSSPPMHWIMQQPPLGPRLAAPTTGVEPVDVLARSSRIGSGPVDRSAALSALAQLSVVRSSGVDQAGRIWTSRVAPSAGGTHAIRPLLMLNGPGMTATWWRSTGSAVQQINPSGASRLVADTIEAQRGAAVETCLFAVAEPDTLSSRYPDGESLLWRDAGAFAATAQFLAAGLGLGSRIIGIARELDSDGRTIPAFVVAAVVLGNLAACDA